MKMSPPCTRGDLKGVEAADLPAPSHAPAARRGAIFRGGAIHGTGRTTKVKFPSAGGVQGWVDPTGVPTPKATPSAPPERGFPEGDMQECPGVALVCDTPEFSLWIYLW